MTLSEYHAMLFSRRRTLREVLAGSNPHSSFRGWPQAELEGRLCEVSNALDMLDRVEAAAAMPATGHPDPEFARIPEPPPVARSLAPSWGVTCPYCGYRNHVRDYGSETVTHCAGCRMFYRQPAGALTVDEARVRPTEVTWR